MVCHQPADLAMTQTLGSGVYRQYHPTTHLVLALAIVGLCQYDLFPWHHLPAMVVLDRP